MGYYKLGDKFLHFSGGEKEGKAIVVAVRQEGDEWDILEDYKQNSDLFEAIGDTSHDVVLFAELDWDECFITEYELENYDSWDDGTDYTVLISEANFKKRQEIGDKIIAILKENQIDTNDLIVSDGKVFQGYSDCATYIQTTHAWCSSSMSC